MRPCPATKARTAIEGRMAKPVIGRTALRVLQDLVSFIDNLEAFFGSSIPTMPIWVTFLREPPERGFDLDIVGAAGNAQDLIVALLRHHPSGPSCLVRLRTGHMRPSLWVVRGARGEPHSAALLDLAAMRTSYRRRL